jgi:hypothetical protein
VARAADYLDSLDQIARAAAEIPKRILNPHRKIN